MSLLKQFLRQPFSSRWPHRHTIPLQTVQIFQTLNGIVMETRASMWLIETRDQLSGFFPYMCDGSFEKYLQVPNLSQKVIISNNLNVSVSGAYLD